MPDVSPGRGGRVVPFEEGGVNSRGPFRGNALPLPLVRSASYMVSFACRGCRESSAGVRGRSILFENERRETLASLSSTNFLRRRKKNEELEDAQKKRARALNAEGRTRQVTLLTA